MITTARHRANLFMRQLLSLVDVFPLPIINESPKIGCFEMTWKFDGLYCNVASFNDGRFEFFVEEGEGKDDVWDGESTLPFPPAEFLQRFKSFCEKHHEQEPPAKNTLLDRRAKPA